MLNGIMISQDKKRAVVHFDTHSVTLSHDVDVTVLVQEFFIEPQARLQRSLEETQWIITMPSLEEDAA